MSSLRERLASAIYRRFGPQPVRRSYDMAKVNRLTGDWVRAPLSADQELRGSAIGTLKARSRDLVKNTFWGRQWVRLYVNNVIGPQGIMLQSRVTKADGTLDDDVNEAVENAFWAWGRRVSVDGRHTWLSMQRLLAGVYAQDGESLLEMIPGYPNPFLFALRAWDTDLLDPEFHRGDPGMTRIVASVEMDAMGAPIAYHLLRVHPNDTPPTPRDQLNREVIAVSRMCHDYDPARANQTRGVPPLAPVGSLGNQLHGYWEAEVVAARTAAAKMGFIQLDPEHYQVDPSAEPAEQLEASAGEIVRLGPGETFAPWTPDHPSTAFQPFSTALLRGIAAGLGVSYETLCGDLSQTSYSSGRIGLLAEREMWQVHQQRFCDNVCARVFAAWLPQAILAGQVPGVSIGRVDEIVMAAQWQPRRWPWVDPEKDLNATETALRLMLTSRTRVLAEQGIDPVELFAEIERERKLMDDKGLDPEVSDGSGQPPGAEQPDDTSDADDAGAPAGGDRAERPA